jgi:hypothetical protein
LRIFDIFVTKVWLWENWQKGTAFCISISVFSTVVEGFCPGDPLYSLLFVFVMKALSSLIARVVSGGFLFGFSINSLRGDPMVIFHLHFADDPLIFCDAGSIQLCYLRCILICFEEVSSLRINLSKSENVLVREVRDVIELESNLGCSVSSLPMKYLGLPLRAQFKARHIWESILERMQKRPAGWKSNLDQKG